MTAFWYHRSLMASLHLRTPPGETEVRPAGSLEPHVQPRGHPGTRTPG